MEILNIQTRYYDNCNFIYLNYNVIVFGVIYYILYVMNFKDTTNCISSKDRHVDYMLKWKKYNVILCERKPKL